MARPLRACRRRFIRRQDFSKNAYVRENIILNRIGPNYIFMYICIEYMKYMMKFVAPSGMRILPI